VAGKNQKGDGRRLSEKCFTHWEKRGPGFSFTKAEALSRHGSSGSIDQDRGTRGSLPTAGLTGDSKGRRGLLWGSLLVRRKEPAIGVREGGGSYTTTRESCGMRAGHPVARLEQETRVFSQRRGTLSCGGERRALAENPNIEKNTD